MSADWFFQRYTFLLKSNIFSPRFQKIFVRKCEQYTVWEASEPIVVDVEKLRKCEPPFLGETEQDLLEYLNDNVYYN